jgi:hypothetical protein
MPRAGQTPLQNLDAYYAARESTVKLCNEVPDEYFDDVISISPSYKKIERNMFIQNINIITGLKIYEPKKERRKTYYKEAS